MKSFDERVQLEQIRTGGKKALNEEYDDLQ